MTKVRLFLMVGLMGGFTTFSAFSLQTLTLIREGAMLPAAAYVTASVLLCLAGVAIGHGPGPVTHCRRAASFGRNRGR